MKIHLRLLIIANVLAIVFSTSRSAQTPRANFNRTRTFDVLHYTIHTSFDRRAKSFYGETTVKFKPLKNKFRVIELDSVGLKYTSINLEPSGQKLSLKETNDKVLVTLDKDYSQNDIISITLKYNSKPKKGVYFVDESKRRGKPAQVWTQGEAAETRHWFPSYDFPDDKATTEQFITVNKGETAIANGEIREIKKILMEPQTFHFYMPLPHSTYLTSFVVGTYDKFSDKYNQRPLDYLLVSRTKEYCSNIVWKDQGNDAGF